MRVGASTGTCDLGVPIHTVRFPPFLQTIGRAICITVSVCLSSIDFQCFKAIRSLIKLSGEIVDAMISLSCPGVNCSKIIRLIT